METSELLLHLKLDDTSGAIASDSSGKLGRDATLVNADAGLLTESGNATDIGDFVAWDFSKDADAYIQIDDATASDVSPELGSQTIVFWYNPKSQGAQPLYFKGNDTSEGVHAYIKGNDYTIFEAQSDSTKTNIGIEYSDASYYSNWHHFAGVIDRGSGDFLLYIDGSPVANGLSNPNSLNDLGSIDPSTPLYIGFDGVSSYYSGLLDDIRIYGGALTQTQITELRQGTSLGIMTVTLSVSNGTLSLGDTTQVSLVDGNDGVDQISMTFVVVSHRSTPPSMALYTSPQRRILRCRYTSLNCQRSR